MKTKTDVTYTKSIPISESCNEKERVYKCIRCGKESEALTGDKDLELFDSSHRCVRN